jgi:hypothetical protein
MISIPPYLAAGAMTFAGGTVWVYTWTVPLGDGVSTVNITTTDSAGNALGTISGLKTYTVDNTLPIATLTGNEGGPVTDGYVRAGQVVAISATFSEQVTSAAISISGPQPITAVTMTYSGANVWYYNWSVPPGDGPATVTINAADVAGNVMSGGTGTTGYFVDNTAPTIAAFSMGGGLMALVTFTEGVYGTSSGPVGTSCLQFQDLTTGDTALIDMSSHTPGQPGASFNLTWITTPSSGDTIRLTTIAGLVFDTAGNVMAGGFMGNATVP